MPLLAVGYLVWAWLLVLAPPEDPYFSALEMRFWNIYVFCGGGKATVKNVLK
jgi:hypothetical protein